VFEKKLDLSKEWEPGTWQAAVRNKVPKFHMTQHILYFKEDKTFYEKGADIEEKNPYLRNDENANDIIYSDLKENLFVKRQALFEESVVVTDFIRPVQWEMTNETRYIAGFECHKATAIILDSIFIVAFYSDQITVCGGPMSYCNLPGMILGVAIPRMNLTIFATKVELMEPLAEKFKAPISKKKTNYPGLLNLIREATKKMYEFDQRRYFINSLL
jgi:GLPGLI family protein